jgi:hypothetical protein
VRRDQAPVRTEPHPTWAGTPCVNLSIVVAPSSKKRFVNSAGSGSRRALGVGLEGASYCLPQESGWPLRIDDTVVRAESNHGVLLWPQLLYLQKDFPASPQMSDRLTNPGERVDSSHGDV